jgi:predicted nucleotide-binding protein (sugar kinase/HSP70/actin superfamily)
MGQAKVIHDTCTHCANRCKRDIIQFGNGVSFCTGNRCEKGNLSTAPATAPSIPAAGAARGRPEVRVLPSFREKLLLRNEENVTPILPPNGITVGLPLVFEFWNSLPFWRTMFSSLGFTVEVSGRSTAEMAGTGNRFVASDSICFPAKLMHGHIEALSARGVKRLFVPAIQLVREPAAGSAAGHMCPIVQGLPVLAQQLNRPDARFGITVDAPVFAWHSRKTRDKQIRRFFETTFGLDSRYVNQAIAGADAAMARFKDALAKEAAALLQALNGSSDFGVVLLGRPYHADSLVNHRIPELFADMGIPTLTADTLPQLPEVDNRDLRPEKYNPFHTQLYAAALYAARHPQLEVVQLVSFGCGHDAIVTDEIQRLMQQVGAKKPLVLKIDDGECKSALMIRIRSFVETVRQKRARA